MKVKRIENKEERSILIAMVVNDRVLARIASKYDDEMFPSPWSNLVGGWCVSHYRKYRKAPGKAIEQAFEKWAKRADDKSTVSLVDSFIGSLSRQYDEESHEVNVDFVVDSAAMYFTQVKLKRLISATQDKLEQGRIDEANELITGFRKIEMGVEGTSNPYQEMDVHKRTFEKAADPVITYTGPLGKFIGNRFARDSFILFQGPEKGKKSFWMQDVVHRGIKNRRKVFYIQVGDMSEDQITHRIEARLCERPHLEDTDQGVWYYPIKIKRRRLGFPKVTRKRRVCKSELTLGQIKRAQEEFNENFLRSRKTDFLKMHCVAAISMDEIEGMMENWRGDGWVPDIVVLDYIDLVDAPNRIKEPRDQLNYNCRRCRIISQKYHLLFVSGTQANAQAWKKDQQDRSSFSNDKRKMAHVTGMIGLNQNNDELEQMELMKLNWIVVRGRKPYPVWCAGCLALSDPCVLSV